MGVSRTSAFVAGPVAAIFLSIASPSVAQDTPDDIAQDRPVHPAPRDLCSELGGLDTPACIVDPQHLQVEAGLTDWTLDESRDERKDSIDAGEILLRYGLGGTTELRLGWTAIGDTRTRDRTTGDVMRRSGTGDVTLGLKQSLAHPAEGKTGLAVALLPYATLPTGRMNVGAGDWSAGLIVPTSYKINDTIALEMTPEVDAAVNDNGSGRHLAYGSAFGAAVHLGKTMILTPEVELMRDRDPSQHDTMSRASLSFDIQTDKTTLFDLNAIAGLNRNTPDVELAWGMTHKF